MHENGIGQQYLSLVSLTSGRMVGIPNFTMAPTVYQTSIRAYTHISTVSVNLNSTNFDDITVSACTQFYHNLEFV